MSLTFACPCGFSLSAADAHAGLYARCPACAALTAAPGKFKPLSLSSDSHRIHVNPESNAEGEKIAVLAVPPVPSLGLEPTNTEPSVHADAGGDTPAHTLDRDSTAPTQTAATAMSPSVSSTAVADMMCAACADEVSDTEARMCIHCRTAHHVGCWDTAGGCAVPTCAAGPKSRKQIVKIADQEEVLRPCPICAEQIPVRAHRCRYCGEFTDPALRQTKKKRGGVRMPTSGYASFSLGFSIVTFFFSLISEAVIQFFTLFLIGTTIILALRGFRDIHKSAGKKSGHIPASFALGISALNLLIWILKMV